MSELRSGEVDRDMGGCKWLRYEDFSLSAPGEGKPAACNSFHGTFVPGSASFLALDRI